jgi:hypothetical protein
MEFTWKKKPNQHASRMDRNVSINPRDSVIEISREYDKNATYMPEVKDDIVVYAAYPRNPSFLYMLSKLLSFNFKKIYFIYSVPEPVKIDLEKTGILHQKGVEAVCVENKGYDFMKYLIGLQKIKENNESYSKIWLMNDSFIVTKWDLFAFHYNAVKGADLLSPFLSLEEKKHLQSYLLIMTEKVADFYRCKLSAYPFQYVTDQRQKRQLIVDLEIGLFNHLIESQNISYLPVFPLRDCNWEGNPALYFGGTCGIVKEEFARRLRYDGPFRRHAQHVAAVQKLPALQVLWDLSRNEQSLVAMLYGRST